MSTVLRSAICTILLFPAMNASAQSDSELNINEYPGWIVGAGYVAAPDPFIGDADDASQFFPIIGYIGERLTWMGPYAEYKIFGDEMLSTSAVVDVDFSGFDSDSAEPLLGGLTERKSAVLVGFDVDYGPVSLSGRTDVSGRHNGSSFDLAFTQGMELSDKFSLEAGLSAEWQSRDIVDYYYGVTAIESTSTRPIYSPGNAINVGAGLELTYQLNGRSILFFGADAMRLDSEIARSPIVDDDYEFSAYAGFVYQLFE